MFWNATPIFAPKSNARLLALIMLFAIALLATSGAIVLSAGPSVPETHAALSPSQAPSQAQVDALRAQIENLKIQTESLRNKEDDLKWILGFILAASALFAVAQTVTTWFNVESFNKRAENSISAIKDKEKEIKDIENEIRKNYPLFSETEELRKQSLDSLARILPDEGFNWQRHYYEQLPLQQRQQLLAVERFLSYEIAGQDSDNATYARTLRKLAQFYFSKFIYEKDRGCGQIDDLERAEYFLELARKRIGPAFYLANDLGNVHIESFKARMEYLAKHLPAGKVKAEAISGFQQAIRDFAESIEFEPRQLRAYYNLAVLEADNKGDLKNAIEWLQRGLMFPNWEHEPLPELTCAAWFNLACYYVRLSGQLKEKNSGFQDELEKGIAALEKAARIGRISPEDVQREFSGLMIAGETDVNQHTEPLAKPGDLYPLVQFEEGETFLRVSNLKPMLSVNYGT
jgi:hypothetical protein